MRLPERTRIKICGLTREADVETAVACGVDAIGFVLYPKSPRFVSADRAATLAGQLPPFVTPVLLFVNASPQEVEQACQAVPGALLQFHGDETPEACEAIAHRVGRRWLRAARIPLGQPEPGTTPFDLVKYAFDYSNAQAILLDAHADGYGGSGKAFHWSQLTQNVNAHLVLSGGLDSANVGDGIAWFRPRCRSLAVDISSGVEATDASGNRIRGIKDPQKIRAFVAAVRAADANTDPFLAGNP